MEWPTQFKPLLARYGPAAVWLAGLSVLGYPPTWADRFREFEAVRSWLLNTFGV